MENSFQCSNCRQRISFAKFMGTRHRNHCPFCLWSRHLDLEKSGDRKAKCRGKMKPVGLTFKKEGKDKYGNIKRGEIMLIHECLGCGKISINRIAGDDKSEKILEIFKKSQALSQRKKNRLKETDISLISSKNRKEVFLQLFGS